MATSDHARPWLSAAADGMLVAGQGALMVVAVVLALLILLQAAERRAGWQSAVQADWTDPVFCEAGIFGP